MAKTKTEIHVTTVFDGELDAADVFVSLIAQKYGQNTGKKNLAKTQDLGYNKDEVQKNRVPSGLCGLGGCGSLSGRWLHGAEYGASRPETDVKSHRAQADKSCDNERFIEVGSKLLADRYTDRGLLPPSRRPLYRHE